MSNPIIKSPPPLSFVQINDSRKSETDAQKIKHSKEDDKKNVKETSSEQRINNIKEKHLQKEELNLSNLQLKKKDNSINEVVKQNGEKGEKEESNLNSILLKRKINKKEEEEFEESQIKKQKEEGYSSSMRKNYSDSDKAASNNNSVNSAKDSKILPKTHFLPMKGEEYLKYIKSGVKLYEGRICGPTCKDMNIGDLLKLTDRRAGWGIECEITSLDIFHSFEAMLKEKGVLKMLPQLTASSKNLSPKELLEAGVKIYRSFPGANRVTKVGCIAIGVKYLKDIRS